MDPRATWKLGAFVATMGFVLSVVMYLVHRGEPMAAPWRIGMIGFGGVGAISVAGLLLSRKPGNRETGKPDL